MPLVVCDNGGYEWSGGDMGGWVDVCGANKIVCIAYLYVKRCFKYLFMVIRVTCVTYKKMGTRMI